MLFGLAIGLSVAAAIYVSDRRGVPSRPASSSALAKPDTVATPGAPDEPGAGERFDFYEILPRFEVVIPEEDLDAQPDTAPEVFTSPGSYVLQAGSFSAYADADRMKARLALLGIESRIQKVSVDDKNYHRVRVGPVESLEQLNDLRSRLRDARIEIMVIRLRG